MFSPNFCFVLFSIFFFFGDQHDLFICEKYEYVEKNEK